MKLLLQIRKKDAMPDVLKTDILEVVWRNLATTIYIILTETLILRRSNDNCIQVKLL